jgi:hypothetical protein
MSLTNGQKKALHSAARQAGLNDDQRRMIQKGIGGFDSAAAAGWGRDGFLRVMAHYEQQYCDGCLRGCTPHYWRDQARGARPADRLLFAIRREAAGLPEPMTDSQVDAFLARMSGGKESDARASGVYWLSRLLDALKALGERRRREVAAEIGSREVAEGAAAMVSDVEGGGECDEEVPF